MRGLSSQVHHTNTSIFQRSALFIVHNFIIGRSRLYEFCRYQVHNISARYLCISTWRDWFDSSGCRCKNPMWACVIEDRPDGITSALDGGVSSPTSESFGYIDLFQCSFQLCVHACYFYTWLFVLVHALFRVFPFRLSYLSGPALLYSDFSFSQLLTAYKLYPHV